MMTMTLKIKGMSCSHCEKSVTDALKKIGVAEAVVSAKTGSAIVTFDPLKVSVPKLRQAVSDAGYEMVDAKPVKESGYVPGQRPSCCEPPEHHHHK